MCRPEYYVTRAIKLLKLTAEFMLEPMIYSFSTWTGVNKIVYVAALTRAVTGD